MDYPLHITFWLVLRTALVLCLAYGLLRVLQSAVGGLQIQDDTKTRIRSLLSGVTAMYIPLAIVVLVVALILWQQRLIGIPAVLCLILFYKPLSHFFQGLAIRAKGDLKIGSHIHIGTFSGDIHRWGTTELKISNTDGITSIPYGRLYQDGYTLSDHRHLSRHVEYRASSLANAREDIGDIIASSPYIRPETSIRVKKLDDGQLQIKVVPRMDDYLDDIASIIKESGYHEVTLISTSSTHPLTHQTL